MDAQSVVEPKGQEEDEEPLDRRPQPPPVSEREHHRGEAARGRVQDALGARERDAEEEQRRPREAPGARFDEDDLRFLEAFANVYCNFADAVRARIAGKKPCKLLLYFPNVDDGLR